MLGVKQQPVVLCSCMQHRFHNTDHMHLFLTLQQAHKLC